MTAYARAHFTAKCGSYLLELHSVNRKVLDITTHLLPPFLPYDILIRKTIAQQVKRGQITVRITRLLQEERVASPESLKPLKKYWEEIAEKLGFSKKEITLNFLLEQLQEMPQHSQETGCEPIVIQAVEQALVELLAVREEEGKMLLVDIYSHLVFIEKLLAEIKAIAPDAIGEYREHLIAQLKDISALDESHADRIEREVLLYADRVDVTEEITRLHSHLVQFRAHLKSDHLAVGKMLDFMLQEMIRETSTISVKTRSFKLSHLCLQVKNALSTIKEQVHNVE